MTDSSIARPARLATTLGLLAVLSGLALGVGGVWLVSLGGSWYYALAAASLLATGLLLWRRSALALWLYALLFAASLAWSLWEAGLDWWQLAARLGVLSVLGLLMLLPWVTRALSVRRRAQPPTDAPGPPPPALDGPSPLRRGGVWLLATALAAFAVVAAVSWLHDPYDIDGALPPSQGALVSLGEPVRGVPPDEWHAYGRTGYGQRYSPLDQITPVNVAGLKVAWHFHTGDLRGRPGDPLETTFQVTPLKVGNRLFLCTPHQSVIALDATTGQQLWRYEPQLQGPLALQHLTCRGLSYTPAAADATDSLASVVVAPGAVAAAAAGAVPWAAGSSPSSSSSSSSSMPAAPVLPASVAAAALPGSAGATAAGAASSAAMASAAASLAAASSAAAASGSPRSSSSSTSALAAASAAPLVVAAQPAATCAAMLFMPTADGRLLALDPATGAPCPAFGGGKGEIDLWAHMPNPRPGAYYSTSPVVVTAKLVIVGGTVLDNVSTHEQSGVIRAFDVRTGALVWNWDSGRPEATAPIAAGDRYTVNSPNSWSISSVDETLGMVYVPMGNQPPDQWGGQRSEAVEKYASSVVALDLLTGQVRWVFQTVHHDLWDYDVPSQPSLVDLRIAGVTVPALVQPTKQGELFVLDRRTGVPVHPVQEVPAPQGAAEGDHTAPTQPKTALSFDPPRLRGRDMWGATLFDQLACRVAFHRLRYDGRFTPPSTQGSLVYPGNFGVFNWGSVAVDPRRQIAFTTPTYLAFVSRLVPRPDDTRLMVQGKTPPSGNLPALNENFGAPFAADMRPFLSPLGLPCQAPPWGFVAGADLTSGKIAWRHRNGTVRDLSPLPLPFKMGVPSLGGPIVTAGGVAFLSGSLDDFVRAYDVSNGRQLWESRLPAGGQATPMSYRGEDGRQFLLVVAGGHGSAGTRAGDSVIAYALPAK